MKWTIILSLFISIIFSGCVNETENPDTNKANRVVGFKSIQGAELFFQNNQLKFIPELQATDGKNKSVSWVILDGDTEIQKGEAVTSTSADGGLGLFWIADTVIADLPLLTYNNKEIKVHLDRENNLSNDQVYKVETITIK